MKYLCLALLGASLSAAEVDFRPSLLEVQLDHGSLPAGSRLGITWIWQNTGTEADLGEQRVFVHVRRPGEDEAAPNGVRLGGDHSPAVPTRRWTAGRVVRSTSGIALPATMPPGEYLLLVGLYDLDSGQRLALGAVPEEAGRRYLAARFTVLPAGPPAGPALTNRFAPVPAQLAASPPTPPAKTATLRSGDLSLVVDAAQPRLVSWRLDGHGLPGDPELLPPTVRVIETATGRPKLAGTAALPLTWTAKATADSYVWHGQVASGGQAVVEFDVACRLSARAAELALTGVVERAGWELQSVHLDRLVATAAGGKLALPWHAGRLVDPARCEPAECVLGMDWTTQALAGVVHGGPLAASLRVPSVDDRLVASTEIGRASCRERV